MVAAYGGVVGKYVLFIASVTVLIPTATAVFIHPSPNHSGQGGHPQFPDVVF
jgi:hypothetical protein